MPHLQSKDLNAYLDNLLNPDERRHHQTHLAKCPACEERLRELSYLDKEMRQGFGRWKTTLHFSGDMNSLLAERSQPTASLNNTSVTLAFVCALIMLMPLLSRVNPKNFSTHPELINLPASLEAWESDTESITPEALGLWAATPPMLAYHASPVPLPQATAAASFEPKN